MEARFVLRRDPAVNAGSRPEIGINVAAYDAARPLVIDPVFDYATYVGGSGSDAGMGITVDAGGSAYIAGYTSSLDLPGATGPPPSGGSVKAFVAKLNPTGTGLIFATYLGGDGNDVATAIAVDPECRITGGVPCNVYVTGRTDSTDFPTVNAYQTNQGGTDAFVAKLDPSGVSILYSTYLGGSGTNVGLGIAVGFGASDTGQIYVTGYTESMHPNPSGGFPRRLSIKKPQSGDPADAFVAKFNPNAAGDRSLVYSSLFGGALRDESHAIAVDVRGQAHVTGFTESADFPRKLAYLGNQPGTDAFVSKLKATGQALIYSTYVGGSGTDVGLGIALDSLGKIYITGYTDSTDFPTKTPYQGALLGRTAAFVTKLDPKAASLQYSTYLGADGTPSAPESGVSTGVGIAVGPGDHVYVTGFTESPQFPLISAVQTYGGGRDAFVVRLRSENDIIIVVYSTYVGGSGREEAYGIAVDGAGRRAYITGLTESGNFPTVPILATTLGGAHDAFVAKIGPGSDRFRRWDDRSAVRACQPPSVHHLGVHRDGDRDDDESWGSRHSCDDHALLSRRPDLGRGRRSSWARGRCPLLPPAKKARPPTASRSAAPGSYFIIAVADATGLVAEGNEGNNTTSTENAVFVGGDLRVDRIDVPEPFSRPLAGAVFTITVHTKNDSGMSRHPPP